MKKSRKMSAPPHETFYYNMIKVARNNDVFRKAFFYTVGISAETRNHITALFDFEESLIKPEGLSAPWQTGSTKRLCRLAFNLWNGWTEEGKEQIGRASCRERV